MLYSFADHVLDVDRRELRRGVERIAVEPQVFDLLVYLIRNRDRVASKDDLIASIWDGRIVSESTLTSRINAVRKAVGESGTAQQVIRTIARKGVRFVADVRESGVTPAVVAANFSSSGEASIVEPVATARTAGQGECFDLRSPTSLRASVAIMPFADESPVAAARGGLADGLAHDVITRLAKLRSLFVIAQGTVFALHERNIGPEEVGRLLNVTYVVNGSVRRSNDRVMVAVELSEVETARIVWTEVFNPKPDEAFLLLEEIGDLIVASIASEIETLERNRAILRPPNSLDAWQSHHRGLWHMYRFSKSDNEQAQRFFEMAVELDPTFARAYAGLSFTHWQNVFQGWTPRDDGIERAYASAGQSLMADDRDPAAHWAMGRALWLRRQQDQSIDELNQAVELSPNFALAHYNLAFVNATVGDPLAAISSADCSRNLSPFDPLLFGMLAARAMALARLGRFEEAVDFGVKAAARPNAHAHILAIAACTLALADRRDEARAQLAAARKMLPNYGVDDLVTAMQFDPEGEKLFREAARRIGPA